MDESLIVTWDYESWLTQRDDPLLALYLYRIHEISSKQFPFRAQVDRYNSRHRETHRDFAIHCHSLRDREKNSWKNLSQLSTAELAHSLPSLETGDKLQPLLYLRGKNERRERERETIEGERDGNKLFQKVRGRSEWNRAGSTPKALCFCIMAESDRPWNK